MRALVRLWRTAEFIRGLLIIHETSFEMRKKRRMNMIYETRESKKERKGLT